MDASGEHNHRGLPVRLLLADELITCGFVGDMDTAMMLGERIATRYAYALHGELAAERDRLAAELGAMRSRLERLRALGEETPPEAWPRLHRRAG